MKTALVPLFCLLLVLGADAAAGSDKKASREREALRRAQQQLAQAQGQLSTLEQEKAKLTLDLSTAQKAAKSAEGRAARLNRELKGERQRREGLEKEAEQLKLDLAGIRERLEQTAGRLTETQGTLAHTQRTLAATEADKRGLEAVKARQEREIALCEDKNLKLYQTGRELMTRFEKKSCGETLIQGEPFTGLKRVEVENLLEEYRDKLDEQKLVKPPGG